MDPAEARAQLERATAFVNTRDLDGLLDLVHPEIRWIPPPGSADRAVFEGPEGVRAFMTEWLEPWDAFHQELLELEMKGGRGLARVRIRARGHASGVEIDVEGGYVAEFDDAGLVRRMELYPSYAAAAAAF